MFLPGLLKQSGGGGGGAVELIGTYTGTATIDISAYSGATVDNFIIEPSAASARGGDITRDGYGCRSESSFALSKQISGNILNVSCSVNGVAVLYPFGGGEERAFSGASPSFKVYYAAAIE